MKRIVTGDRNLQSIQDNVAQALGPIEGSPFQAGLLMANVALASGANTFSHSLGRVPQGWVVTDRNGAATVYRNSWTDKFLNLQASSAVTVSLWVF